MWHCLEREFEEAHPMRLQTMAKLHVRRSTRQSDNLRSDRVRLPNPTHSGDDQGTVVTEAQRRPLSKRISMQSLIL
jgi:hypothetical protein